MKKLQVAVFLLIASTARGAHSDVEGQVFAGTQTKTIYKNGVPSTTTTTRSVTPIWQTDASGKVLPTFSNVEVVGADQWTTTFTNPVALPGPVTGYILDMTVTKNGQSPQSIGKIVMQGTPGTGPCGFWPSWSSQGTKMVGENGRFFSQNGYTIAHADGSCTWHRSGTIVDDAGNFIGTLSTDLTSSAH